MRATITRMNWRRRWRNLRGGSRLWKHSAGDEEGSLTRPSATLSRRERARPNGGHMKRWIGIFAAVTCLMAQAPSGSPFRIEKLDAALDEVIAPDVKLETLGDRFALTEGPVWVPGRPG